MRIYQFKSDKTGLIVLMTNNPKIIEKHFKMTIKKINEELEKTGLIKNEYSLTTIFVD